MKAEFTAIIEAAPEGLLGICPEIPGANGQERRLKRRRTLARSH